MSIIKTQKKCTCGEFLVKDTEKHGDWYPTSRGVVHQSFCPNDGKMWPLIEERPVNFMSNNNKKRLLNQLARTYQMRFKELMSIYHKFLKDKEDKYDIISILTKQTKLSEEQIIIFCSN